MSPRASLRQFLREVLQAETGQDFSPLPDEARLREHLGLDSVDLVGVVSHIEWTFHVRLSHQELKQLVCVGDMLDLLQRKACQPTRWPEGLKVQSL